MSHFFSIHPLLNFSLRDAVVAGSTGRMAMILLIYLGPAIKLPRVDAVSLLGSLVAPTKEAAVTLGGAIHFSMGVVFAIIYAALWDLGIGSPTWYWGFLFGLAHGMLVLILVFLLMRLHPLLSNKFHHLSMISAILLNHIVFGVVVALVYSSR